MIVGIGVDLVTISRVGKIDRRFAERFERRILTEAERLDIDDAPDRARFLAKRFAVKEAAVKALGTGERDGVLLKDIGLTHDALGKPSLCISGAAHTRCEALNVRASHVTLSDEGDLITAFVVLEA